MAEPEWGKEYWSVILLAQASTDAAGAQAAALARARELGVPEAALGTYMDCTNGLTSSGLGVPDGAALAWARFDTQEHAKAFAQRFGASQVLASVDDCGG